MGGTQWSAVKGHYSIHAGEYSTIGKRSTNEDEVFVKMSATKKSGKKDSNPPSLFGVLDGHSGTSCSKYVKETLPDVLRSHDHYPQDLEKAMIESFCKVDKLFLADASKKKAKDGSTGLVMVIHERHCVVANAGDSRAILLSKSGIIPLSIDHKPDVPAEKERIERMGGSVSNGRINGNKLSVSRGFGDLKFKNKETHDEGLVTVIPDILKHEVTDDVEAVVLACDGFWDVISNEEMGEKVKDLIEAPKRMIKQGIDPCQEIYSACIQLCEWAGQKGSKDNLTVVLVVFHHKATKKQKD
eukprot:CAMPEP_0201485420 /NCGR_PEP_ID=MMETSP0151_2-20130828/9528_1 /ASSEMBLY_ACC=CAM_ASM_000257 /TAXON_ID=200890 /ORGANISM="Paramoeba atlantica, Strain 621/1 / CCAP 1560/9" /LENGTH=298 /DNA_ID=CAMNT_0047869541 /DNA_START=248 /DNA_END=1144 /DNA_ORIENTATION=+